MTDKLATEGRYRRDIMKIGTRNISKVCLAALEKRHYIAAKNRVAVYADPVDACRRYLSCAGSYPASVTVRAHYGPIELMLYSSHDLRTVNEIFCREDYKADDRGGIIVDFGSNIGISAAYFLSRNTTSFAYLFEPVPRNIDRLNANLAGFRGRYELSRVAVAPEPGVVSFGCEETGRYGGIGKATDDTIQVDAVSASEVLGGIIAKHGKIDILKIDIETLEEQVIDGLPLDLVKQIRTCYIEYRFVNNPFSRTHEMRQYGAVAQFRSLLHHN